ncbi:cyclic dehypoxanthine futalosine synthase [Collibacillus ludicampi]|jgi:cyclic dehypoxanthinyl futalosine synthase|uniref:Cyclic dehypoxanthine futalosine synthase n=1 Tax=Collibacillus ludicampi TaxID=2771369 RepID=A0AAV4LLZ4_9BACL|nr:cyclic dehypoxanthinyl futalosine synthase [Collibacillus ludicampi]GIM48192.1 cyclic dehypoxanthine futalosine synthase [Collibacillus ludicampi]
MTMVNTKSTPVDEVLDKALSGERLTLEDGIALYESDDLLKIGSAAKKVMMRLHPDNIVTFVINRNINYTNVCDTYCTFCAFYRKVGHKEAYVLKDEIIFDKIQETIDLGGTEILMQGGTHPDLPFEYYLDLLRKIKARFDITMHSFSAAEIWKMVEVSGLSLEEVIRQLKEAGLDSLPGGGAEILDDRTRMRISRLKGSWTKWMEVHDTAHRLGMNTTATMVIGFGESYEERVLHMLRVREQQDKTGRFTAFIPWTYQPDNTALRGTRATAVEYLKTVAISRLVLDNIKNIQASWVTMGSKIGQISLEFGCNDMGSTMIEENVVAAAGAHNRMNRDELVRLIQDAGKIAAQRTTQYQILRTF